MDGLGDQFLPGPGFAVDQNGGVGGCDARGYVQGSQQRGGGTDDGFKSVFLVQAAAENLNLFQQTVMLQRPLDQRFEFVGVNRFGEIVVGPGLHGFDRGLHGPVGRHYDYGGLRIVQPYLLEQFDSGDSRKMEVGYDEVLESSSPEWRSPPRRWKRTWSHSLRVRAERSSPFEGSRRLQRSVFFRSS